MSEQQRKGSFTAEELTPIVLSQLQNANKIKGVVRRSSQVSRHGHGDSESESCGEESRKKTAEAFMSGIKSALNDQNDNRSGLSQELVTEVDSVLSKLMSSVEHSEDTNLVPLITSLQATLKANVAEENKRLRLAQSNSNSLTSEASPGTPGSGSGVKDWHKDPFHALPKRPPVVAGEVDCEPVEAKVYQPEAQVSELSGRDDDAHAASKIPWKIRAARKRSMKHHTTGMTKEELARIKKALEESNDKLSIIHQSASDKSKKDERKPRTDDEQEPRAIPKSFQAAERSRDVAEPGSKAVDSFYKASDLGYASDVCDYNVDHVQENRRKRASPDPHGRIQQDTSYVHQKRPMSMPSQESQSSSGYLSVPAREQSLSQQSSTEDERPAASSKNKNRPASAVRAKIARRKMMRQANALDQPQGSLSDQDVNNEDEDSVEEKQDKEAINEKHLLSPESAAHGYGPLLTPESSRRNWSSRFSNIKNSFDAASEEDSKSRSPSINRQSVPSEATAPPEVADRGRAKTRNRSGGGGVGASRSKSAHNVQFGHDFARIDYADSSRRPQSKEDKNKLNVMTASQSKSGYKSDNQRPSKKNSSSGRDSVDYHQYLEMIERFRDNNPKAYSRPLQKIPPTPGNITFRGPQPNAVVMTNQFTKPQPVPGQKLEDPHQHQQHEEVQPRQPSPQQQQQQRPSPPKLQQVQQQHHQQQQQKQQHRHQPQQQQHHDAQEDSDTAEQAAILGLVKTKKDSDALHKKNDMDYQEYMNIIDKVRKTKEVTRVRFEQMRLATMYAKERQRQKELQMEEERLKETRQRIEQERRASITDSNHEQQQQLVSQLQQHHDLQPQVRDQRPQQPQPLPAKQQPSERSFAPAQASQDVHDQDQARIERLKQERMEQRRQEELREQQVRAEQERLSKLREQQLTQEREREEIRRLEQERLLQIQEEHQRLELERLRQEENMRLEQQRLEEEKRRQERLQAERNALYHKQRLDMEAKNFAMNDGNQVIRDRIKVDLVEEDMSQEERLLRERLMQQEKLREEHKKEESQIRQEKLNLLQQEQSLLLRQEEMLKQIEEEREQLAKQESLIRSKQAGRLQQVRQEKMLLEEQEEMLKMREQQLLQERVRQEDLRREQRVLREQEEAIKRRQEEISKELLMSDLSDTGSESITMCLPREGQVFKGKKPSFGVTPLGPVGGFKAPFPKTKSDTEDNTLDEDEDYYESKVEVKQKATSVPTSVRTIETKIDNPPWAPITPYLSYADKQNQEELSAILDKGALNSSGIITSPESTRASTALITTPESSLQSQISQNDLLSISSSCPNSPPPVPPVPQDMFHQPPAPPRDDSFGVTAVFGTDPIFPEIQPHQTSVSPRLGGPGSAFKPYASAENLFDATMFANTKSPDTVPSSTRPIFAVSNSNIMRNGFLGGGHVRPRQPLHSKVKELKQQQQHPPFSTTDTEPEMRECRMPPFDSKGKKMKSKAPTYSTSETEEEYQAYLRMRPRWHGKGGHKDSWDPLQIESPPQITQKPVGIIQRPKAQAPVAPMVVERGMQVNRTPVFFPSDKPQGHDDLDDEPPETVPIDAPIPAMQPRPLINDPNREFIQKSDSIIEVRGLGSTDQAKSPTSLIPWAKAPVEPDKIMHPLLQKSEQIKNMQEKYLENVNSTTTNTLPKIGPFAKIANDQQAEPTTRKMFSNIQRTNPTIAAMEIMTRKEMKLNEMEERKARELRARAKTDPGLAAPAPALVAAAPVAPQGPRAMAVSIKPEAQPTVIIGNFVPRMAPAKVPVLLQPVQPLPEKTKAVSVNEAPEPTPVEPPLVKPHPSMINKLNLERVSAPNHFVEPVTTEQPVILLKKQPKILAPEEIRARKNSAENKSPQVPKKKLIAEVRPQQSASSQPQTEATISSSIDDDSKITKEKVRRAAERFEQAAAQDGDTKPVEVSPYRPRSKSIGNNLSQRMQELEDDKTRIKESLTQTKTFLPWTESAGGGSVKKAPVLRRRDAMLGKANKAYDLRQSKSSDSISAAKLMAEQRMKEARAGQSLRINANMSKSIERQLDVYTKTKEDIRKILDLAKKCSVSDKIKLFNEQKAIEPPKDDDQRERRAEEIRKEIEDARKQQIEEMEQDKKIIAAHRVNMQEPVESKVKPLKIPMKSKLLPSGESLDRGVPGQKLRINQPGGGEHKSEIRSILRNNRSDLEKRLSIENLPSVKSKIDVYLQQAAEDVAGGRQRRPTSPTSMRRTASLDRKKAPKLIHSHTLGDGDVMQIYAQSATDYSATEDEDERRDRRSQRAKQLLDVPEAQEAKASSTLRKSKSFAGQFECQMDEDEVEEKQKTMLAFFQQSPSPRPAKAVEAGEKSIASLPESVANLGSLPMTKSAPQLLRQESISDDMLEDHDLRDVDAVFESLLNNTFEPERERAAAAAVAVSDLGSSPSLGGRVRPSQRQSVDNSADSDMLSGGGSGGVAAADDQAKKVLVKQQTWAGPDPPHSPSPSHSEYDTCHDPWD